MRLTKDEELLGGKGYRVLPCIRPPKIRHDGRRHASSTGCWEVLRLWGTTLT